MGAKTGTKKWGTGGPPVFQRTAQEKPHLKDEEDTGEPPVPLLEDERTFLSLAFNLSRVSDPFTYPTSVP